MILTDKDLQLLSSMQSAQAHHNHQSVDSVTDTIGSMGADRVGSGKDNDLKIGELGFLKVLAINSTTFGCSAFRTQIRHS